MKFTLKAVFTALVVVIVIVFFSGLYSLEEGQQAIVVQFGRPVGDPVTEAGLHMKLPVVQEVRRFEKRLLVWDGDPNQVPTKGREFIWVDTTAQMLRQMMELRIRAQVEERRLALLEQAVKTITQRVNLFDKVLIPRARQNIKRIQIYLSDLQTAAVVRSKIAKRKRAVAEAV